MSERDLHQLFAEAVVCNAQGIENRPEAYEIITGIREMKEGEERTLTNPIFQHVIVRQRGGVGSVEQAVSKVPLKMQLADTNTMDEVLSKIRDAFREKLQSILQLDSLPGLDFGPDDLGMDSLIAVEIRNWFLKELGVDMRKLKVT
jgi:hybrid polyketide synthase/nonribosomal peptide synthetase ACE1